jgi:F-type H+-transporting ATPase subunit c
MEHIADLLHYGTIALAVGINSAGVGIGEGISGKAALQAMNIQPKARADIAKTAILGMALGETAAFIGVSVAAMLLFSTLETTLYTGIAEISIALAVCIPGFFIGIISSLPAQQACLSIARQPFFSKKILYFMIINQSILQTPIIFGFIIAMFIKGQMACVSTYAESLRLFATGLCIGIGSIGPSIGLGIFARAACKNISINRQAYDQLFSFVIVSQALIETPIVFSLTISLLLAFSAYALTPSLGIAYLCAGACMAIGTLGSGISSGLTAACACKQIAFNTDNSNEISRTSILAQGLIDTSAIYTFIIACALIFWH